MSIGIYKLNCASSGHPYLQSGALPRGYLTEFFNGEPLPNSWTPPPFEVKRAKAKLPDIIAWKEYLPLISARGVDIFSEFAPGCAEYRKFMSIRGRDYFVVNVLAKEDVLDLKASDLTLSADGGVKTVRRFAFLTENVKSPIFKLANLLDGPIFVTRGLAQAIVEAGLCGFQFRDPGVNETSLLFSGADVNAYPNG